MHGWKHRRSGFNIHRPEREPENETATQLWLEQVESHPRNTNILRNASQFFLINDSEKSEALLKQACELEPDNPEWPERLGRVFAPMQSKASRTQINTQLQRAFQELQRAERMRDKSQTGLNSDDPADVQKFQQWLMRRTNSILAKAAYDAREFQVAKNYATELLNLAASSDVGDFFRNDGNAIHHGNLILGQVALQTGDLDQAKERLILNARIYGSPQLDSFGPNMSLAKELLERGEREVVLQFFMLCAKFWELGSDRLAEWIRQVRAGELPVFGANLRY